ncbi:MAG TPA: hypothetical protein VFU72_02395 [Nitrolancea sp.]|nr:hypothetical protein [Nitrolancea sp.]
MSDKNEPNLPRIPRRSDAARHANLLFGSVEDLLADLIERGAPDGRVVRIERAVRNNVRQTGGSATLGVAVTARREDEVLSCWVVVSRLSLDPWGQPTDRTRASALTARHHDAQRIIGALFADAGFDVRLGLYRLPDDCYRFAATCAALDQQAAAAQAQPGTDQPRPSGMDRPSTAEDLTSPDDPNGEHTPQHLDGEAEDVH